MSAEERHQQALSEMLYDLAIDSQSRDFNQLALKLCEEAGEVAKQTRSKPNLILMDHPWWEETLEELGDVLSAILKLTFEIGRTPEQLIIAAHLKRLGENK